MAVPRLEYTLGTLGLVYALVALFLDAGLLQLVLLLAAALFSAAAVTVWLVRRRRAPRG